MKPRRAEPPDGGYGWVVVASAFCVLGLTGGVLKNHGHFFINIQKHFGVLNSTTSWVPSTTIGMFHIGAPAASALTSRFSQRVVIILGGLLCTFGMVLASMDLSLPWLFLSMGVLEGLGLSFSWVSAMSMVSHYFVRWRPIAYAIVSSGECVFAFIFSPVFRWLIEMYTWRGALLIIGGLQLNLCVCGALMRPLESTGGPEHGEPKRAAALECSLLKRPELLLYILFAIFAAAGFFIPTLFLVPLANSLGMVDYWPALVLSVLAAADLVGRLFSGWLANMRVFRNLQQLTTVACLLGVVLLLLPVSHLHWAVMTLGSLYGFLLGCVVAIHVTCILDIVTLESFDSALGLMMMFRSIGGFMGPPAAGWLVDHMNSYSSAFYLAGCCLISSAMFTFLVDHLIQRRKMATVVAAEAADGENKAITRSEEKVAGKA